MALAENRLVAGVWTRLQTKVGIRFTRFVGVAIASLAATEIALSICGGAFPRMGSTTAAIISWFTGAVVSYVLSRWAWERKGKPDVLRETVPFWVISALVLAVLTLANKFGYKSAGWMHLHGAGHVLWVDFVWLIANFVTFLLRFLIFHYVLFTERTTAARAAATGPDAVPPGTRHAPRAAAAPHSAAPGAAAEAAGSAGSGRAGSGGAGTTSAATGARAAEPGPVRGAAPASTHQAGTPKPASAE